MIVFEPVEFERTRVWKSDGERHWHRMIPINPMGKPRATQRDKFKPSKAVRTYRAWADEFRLRVGSCPDWPSRVSWVAYLAIPPSIKGNEFKMRKGQRHEQTPDRDNIDKAILDALWNDDSIVSGGELAKYWDDGHGARIELHIVEPVEPDACRLCGCILPAPHLETCPIQF